MLTTLPSLPSPLKPDPAPASTLRLGASTARDGSFAGLIRHQAEQRLDALRLADQQALAARVRAAAATTMPRQNADQPASRPPMPQQTPAGPSPAAPVEPTAQTSANSANGAAKRAAPGAPTPVRAKATAANGRPDAPGSPGARAGAADTPGTSRAARDHQAGGPPDADPATPGPTAIAVNPPAVPADSGLAGMTGEAASADTPPLAAAHEAAAAAALTSGLGQPLDAAALQAAQAASRPDAPVMTTAEPVAGPSARLTTVPTIQPSTQATNQVTNGPTAALITAPTEGRGPAAPGAAVSAAHTDPRNGQADDPLLDAGGTAAAAARHARAGMAPGQNPDRLGKRSELDAAPGNRANRQNKLAEPGLGLPEDGRPQGSTGPGPLPPAQPDGSAGRAGPVSASALVSQASDRLAATEAAAAEGRVAGAVTSAPAQPGLAAPHTFDATLQTARAQRPAQAGAAADAQRSDETPLALQIVEPVTSPLFAPALGSQLSLLARDGVRSALLQLHPAEMGPISVEIALDGNAAHIDFQALRADTRGLIEASLPALAGALQDAGLTLAGGGVFEQAPGRQPQAQAGQAPGSRQPARVDGGPLDSLGTLQPAGRTASRGLVDLVA